MKFAIVILAALAALSASAKTEPKAFRDGDTISFVGDSITHNGYHQMFLEYYYSTRFPEMKLQYHNRGIAGQSAFHLLKRMESDIFKPKADVYVLMIGMNDVGRKYFTQDERKNNPKCYDEIVKRENTYAECVAKVVKLLSENGRKVCVFTPSIFDDTMAGKSDPHSGLNAQLGQYGRICMQLAERVSNAELVDIWTEMTRINTEFQHNEGADKTIIGGDRVHPSNAGGLVMASIFLKTFGEPALVCSAEIDGNSAKTKNCKVSNIERGNGAVSFDSLEYALPLALSPAEKPVAKYIDFFGSLNRQILAVKNLPRGEYALKIDGKQVGKFAAEKLAGGINIAELETPQVAASREILSLCKKIRLTNERLRYLVHLRYFVYQRKMFGNKISASMSADDIAKMAEEAGKAQNNSYIMHLSRVYRAYAPKENEMRAERENMREQIRRLAAPKTHKYAIEPAK